MVDQCKRNSGATLHFNTVLKQCSNAEEQAAKMQAFPEIFLPVLHTAPGAYVMPGAQQLNYDASCWLQFSQQALKKLHVLWYDDSVTSDGGLNLCLYEHYVRDLICEDASAAPVVRALNRWSALIDYARLERVRHVHGDATLENVVIHDNNAFWIDPSVRAVPLYAELDVAKVLQSAFGYEAGEATVQDARLVKWAYKNFNVVGVNYFLATHLARLWPLQPQRRSWACKIAEDFLC